jgi:hypothetical protein
MKFPDMRRVAARLTTLAIVAALTALAACATDDGHASGADRTPCGTPNCRYPYPPPGTAQRKTAVSATPRVKPKT